MSAPFRPPFLTEDSRTSTQSSITTTTPSPALSAFDPTPASVRHEPDNSASADKFDSLDRDQDQYEREVEDYERNNTFEDEPSAVREEKSSGGHAAVRSIEVWGHRGASADLPENTMASFEATCKAGADGIETDIHITSDGRLVMFHDPNLERTTDGHGKIHETPWEGVLEHVRTLEKPVQPIPLFSQVLELLMRPENMHVKLNIDCKVENNPVKLFPLIRKAMEVHPGWEHRLAPRIVLGIWHPKFIQPAKEYLPEVTLYCIVMSVQLAREYFFAHVAGFSVNFACLVTADGQRFRREAAAAGKKITAWTVNDTQEMKECLRWGVRAIITDKPDTAIEIRKQAEQDPHSLVVTVLQRILLPWSDIKYYTFRITQKAHEEQAYLEREGGKFDQAMIAPVGA